MKRLLAGLVLCLSTLALADRVFIEPPVETPADLDPKVLSTLLRNAVSSLGHEIADAPREASYSLRPSVVKLGTSYIVNLEKRVDGKTTHSTSLKARQVEELDDMMSRLVRSTITQVDAKKDARVSEVTEVESTQELRRKPIRKGGIVGVGPGALGKLHSPGLGYYFYLGRGWNIGPLVMGFRWDMCFNPDVTSGTAILSDFNVNLTYFPLDTDISPFFTAEFGLGLARDAQVRSWAGGMELGATAGVALFRTYKLHIQTGIRGVILVNTAFGESPTMGAVFIGASF